MPKAPTSEDVTPTPEAPPKPPAKPKPSHGGPATKAQHAALKRMDKTVIKRMRKR